MYVCMCIVVGQCEQYLCIIIFRLIYAFDKDPKRVETLKAMVQRSGASHILIQLSDFLKASFFPGVLLE